MPPESSAPRSETRTLLLLRHGQSRANADGTFSGWLDVALSARGEQEAALAAGLLVSHGLLPDVAHSSVLTRSIATLDIVLATLDRMWIPTRRSWRLNERHYGALPSTVGGAVAWKSPPRHLKSATRRAVAFATDSDTEPSISASRSPAGDGEAR